MQGTKSAGWVVRYITIKPFNRMAILRTEVPHAFQNPNQPPSEHPTPETIPFRNPLNSGRINEALNRPISISPAISPPRKFRSRSMKRHVLIFGLVGGVLVTLLRLIDYRYLVLEHSFQIYGGLIALTFAVLGIWLGVRLTARRQTEIANQPVVPDSIPPTESFALNERKRDELGITPRELEILGLVAQGLSNREIAGKLFVSENTVKTHCSRTFEKLGAQRRTQAVQLGRQFGLLAETSRPNG